MTPIEITVQETTYEVSVERRNIKIEDKFGNGITVQIGPSGIFQITGSSAMDLHLAASNQFNVSLR